MHRIQGACALRARRVVPLTQQNEDCRGGQSLPGKCFTNAGGQVRWWGQLKKLDVDVEEVDEGLKEEDAGEEDEEMEKEQAQSDSEESEDTDEEEGNEESPNKQKDKAGLPELDFGVDVSRDCYPPAAITLAYLQQRKEERREAEVEKLKMLYGEDYYEGI